MSTVPDYLRTGGLSLLFPYSPAVNDPARHLFVAPYNMQVRRLRAVLPGARIGSVDKFQGQEAPVVIVSMCASAGECGPRGLQSLLDKNRLNVAVSRAQTLAIIIGDPRIGSTACATIDDLERVNMFCRLKA